MLGPFSRPGSTSLVRALVPAQLSPLPAPTRSLPGRPPQACGLCGSALLAAGASDAKGKARAWKESSQPAEAQAEARLSSLRPGWACNRVHSVRITANTSFPALLATKSAQPSTTRAASTAACAPASSSAPSDPDPKPKPPARTQSRPYPTRISQFSTTRLDKLVSSVRTGAHANLPAELLSLSREAQADLTRNTFDRVFPLALEHAPALLKWTVARRLIKLAEQRDWALATEQLVAVLVAGVRWAELTKARVVREGEPARVVQWPTLGRVSRRLTEAALGDGLDAKERAEISEWLVRLALVRVKRTPPAEGANLDPDPLPKPPSNGASLFATTVYQAALSLSQPCAVATPSPSGTALLTALLPAHPRLALRHLDNLLQANLIPTLAGLESFLLSPAATTSNAYEKDHDPYAYARAVLDSACDGGRSGAAQAQAGLDGLLAARLERIERDKAVASEPMLGFLRWLAEEWVGLRLAKEFVQDAVGREEAVGAALRVWSRVFGQARPDQTPRMVNLQALELLVKNACALQIEQPRYRASAVRGPLETTRLAVELATVHLPPVVIANLSHKLLAAVLTKPFDPRLAHSLYDSLRTLASAESAKPFQWHTALRTEFCALVLTAEKEGRPERVIRLYLDWTGDGLVLPADLWTHIWRAAGRRGLVEDVARLVADYEDAGRGRVPARLVALVMGAAAKERRIVKTLRLLSYWRSRPKVVGALGGGGRSVVPLEAYESVLAMLSTSATDRRAAGMEVFAAAMSEGHSPTTTTWNHLLAAQVFRPAFHIEDIDNAGLVFNSLIQAGCAPDARTYSLLLHGFLRLARNRQGKTGVGLHAARQAFERACGRDLVVKGQGVAELMRELGRRGKWDEAKEVGERWWRLVGRDGRTGGSGAGEREQEMALVRSAGEEVEWWEKRAVLDGVRQEGAQVGEEEDGLPTETAAGEGLEEVWSGAGVGAGEDAADEQSVEAFEGEGRGRREV